MIVCAKNKTLGSGKIGKMPIRASSEEQAIRLRFIKDARLYYKVFGREKARRLLKDTEYFIEP